MPGDAVRRTGARERGCDRGRCSSCRARSLGRDRRRRCIPPPALAVVAGLITLIAASLAVPAEETRTFGRFGTVWLYHQTPQPPHVALFVSGDGGWNQGVVDMARELAAMDALVVGVDIIHYLKQLEAGDEKCFYPASDFEALSQFVQKELDYPDYVTPVLVGYSSGATLVYAVLAQAPSTTFRGAISLGFCPDLPLTRPLCRGSGLTWGPGPHGKGYSFEPVQHLETPWIALQGTIDQVCDPAETQEFVGKTKGAQIVLLPKVGHGYSVPKNWLPQFKEAFRTVLSAPSPDPTRLPAAVPPQPEAGSGGAGGGGSGSSAAAGSATARAAGAPTAPADPGDPADLPLIEVPASGPPRAELAVHLTGDGGWSITDKGIGKELAAAGVPVVGWNSLQYYWKKRDPDQAARDLERILRHYLAAWGKERAILIGYSFGADVLPIVFNRLSADLQARVSVVALLGPSAQASFQFHIGEWLGRKDHGETFPVAPEIARIPNAKVFCFYGEKDKDAICASLDPARVTAVPMSGGHLIGGRYDGIVRQILEAAP